MVTEDYDNSEKRLDKTSNKIHNHMIPLTTEERDLIEALRELSRFHRLGIYSSTITQFLAQKEETKRNKSKEVNLD